MTEKQISYDIDGYDTVTAALRELINQYPALNGDEITYAVLDESSGKAMFPVSGAVIESQKTSITGLVRQTCLYPFYVVYRAGGLSEDRKASVKEWLDNLGRWLERQPIIVGGETYMLKEYPVLSDGRMLKTIARQTPAYLDSINENQSENWAINISARYEYEFDT